MTRLQWFALIVTVGVLAALPLAVWFWRRWYRDDGVSAAQRILKNSFVTFVLRLVVRGLDTVVLFVLVGMFDPALLGAYNTAALLVAQYLATMTEFGLGVWLTRAAAREPAAVDRLFSRTLLLRIGLVLLTALPLSALVIGGYELLGRAGVSAPLSEVGRQAIWILLLTLLPAAYSGAMTAVYQARERMEVPALIEVVTALLSFLARMAVLSLGFGVLGLAWAAVAVSSLTAVIFVVLQRRDGPRLLFSSDTTGYRALLAQSFPLMLNNLLAVVFFRFDLFIVRAFGGADADRLVQLYTLPYQLLNLALVLPPALTFAVFPLLARRAGGDRTLLAAAQQRMLTVMLLLAVPLSVVMTVLADGLVWMFARDQAALYQPSVTVLAVLAWFLPLSFVNGLLQYVLIAIERQAAITRAFVIGALFNLLTNLAVIPLTVQSIGPQAALIAAALVTLASEAVLYLVFRPLLQAEGLAPRLRQLLLRPLPAALVLAAALLLLRSVLPGPIGAVTAALIAAPIYLAAAWWSGAIGSEERSLLQSLLRRR
jgi:O-antigen/teichoic acid export membrane protein